MKKIVVFSDSHNTPLSESFKQILNEADVIIFCGDGLSSLTDYLDKPNFYAVRGNCDGISSPDEIELDVEDVKIFITHGHRYSVKSSLLNLEYRAKEINANLVFYGHTHIADETTYDGITLINPGSLSHSFMGESSYCYVVIDKKNIITKFVKIA
ncbi:MAG: YfcE family phosphodiesterase [Christensenellales bacterium]